MIDLSAFEAGEKYPGDYEQDLAEVQERLSRILVAHIVHRKAAIIVVEGWDAAGKGGAIQRLTAKWDPRAFQVWPIAAPSDEERARHFLWRFWTKLPAKGEIAVFDRSWYGRVLVERVEAFATEQEWRRGFDEINEFECQQAQDGVTIVKLFFHVTQKVQDKRLKARLDHPWKRWKVSAEDFRNRARRSDYFDAVKDMFAHTDTRWAPWQVIDGNNKKAARIAALTNIANMLEKGVSMKPPPAVPETKELARKAFGEDG
ncbi:polyphosphate kinase [Sphingomonas sp. LY54]|uniref:polyphosphate kinase 2 family protein n=1 Tax=Sphingomonas sp. LY54 TaxID=3095343 RepID=UPI002D79488F|nr:polyphosphate kinase [Sphingomonas sp. LY54]WRP28839.1 polyphosphate kinase [Sphingomonas sp. LY54]